MKWKEQWKPHGIGFTEDDDIKAKLVKQSLIIATPQIFKFIETQIIEKLIDDIKSDPKFDKTFLSIQHFIEYKTEQLRNSWLEGKE